MTHATDYIRTIEAEVTALESLSGYLSSGAELDSLPRAERELASDLLDASGLDSDSLPELDAISAWLDSYALEVTVHATRTLGSDVWDTARVEVLRTFGGPNARISVDSSSGYARISVAWGSESVEGTVHAPGLAYYLWDLSDL